MNYEKSSLRGVKTQLNNGQTYARSDVRRSLRVSMNIHNRTLMRARVRQRSHVCLAPFKRRLAIITRICHEVRTGNNGHGPGGGRGVGSLRRWLDAGGGGLKKTKNKTKIKQERQDERALKAEFMPRSCHAHATDLQCK
jgi:hypothetical protein